MKQQDKPMANRMIRILNRIISKLDGFYSGEDIREYCMDVKMRLEKEVQDGKEVKG